VAYNGLLKKERQSIHEKIGQVMEELFQDRMPEFCEALAYHFKRGYSTVRAVNYLMKAGEKSFNRHALEESHQYYREAFELLSIKSEKSKEDLTLLVDILLQWALVYQRRASFVEYGDLLEKQENLVISLGDNERTGMFYARLGETMFWRAKYKEAYQYLRKALELGEEIKNQKVIGWTCGLLAWVCPELGMMDEAVAFGKQAQILEIYESDPELFRYVEYGLGLAYCWRGEARKAKDTAYAIIANGQKHSNTACIADGYIILALGHSVAGDFPAAIESDQKAIHFALEPEILIAAKFYLGMNFVANGQYQEGKNVLREIEPLLETLGFELIREAAQFFSGIITVIKGDLGSGISIMEDLIRKVLEKKALMRYAFGNHLMGQVYLQIARGEGEKNLSFLVRNVGFILKTVPFAHKKAEDHLNKAIQTAKEIGAKGVLAQASLDMGRLRQSKGRTDEARKYITEAIHLFEECEADVFLKQAREALAALG
jgi:tetratricopeptide (TPR) repeat protein